MGEESSELVTPLSVKECGVHFRTGIETGIGLSSKIGGITARLMGGEALSYYTPENDSPFAALDEDPPVFTVGVGVPRANGAHIHETDIQMAVWDRGSHREVTLWAHHSIGGVFHANQLLEAVRLQLEGEGVDRTVDEGTPSTPVSSGETAGRSISEKASPLVPESTGARFEQIVKCLDAKHLKFDVDGRKAIFSFKATAEQPRTTLIFQVTEQGLLTFHGFCDRDFAEEDRAALLNFCNRWNANKWWPTAAVREENHGPIIRLAYALPLHRASDADVATFIKFMQDTSQTLWNEATLQFGFNASMMTGAETRDPGTESGPPEANAAHTPAAVDPALEHFQNSVALATTGAAIDTEASDEWTQEECQRLRDWLMSEYSSGGYQHIWARRCALGYGLVQRGATNEQWFWVNAIPAMAGMNEGLKAHPLVATFAGYADQVADLNDPSQNQWIATIKQSYFGAT